MDAAKRVRPRSISVPSIQDLGDSWAAYWFRPAPLFNLSILRIAAVAFQLYYLLWFLNPDLFRNLSTLPAAVYDPLPVLQLLTAPFGSVFRPSYQVLLTIYWISLGVGVLSLFGFRTNLSLLAFAVGSLFLHAYNYSFGDYHHTEALLLITILLLALAPAGRVLSIDGWLRRRRNEDNESGESIVDEKSSFAIWPLLIVQWMFALIYFDGTISKFGMGGASAIGLDWVNGYTLQYYLFRNGLQLDIDLGIWLAQYHNLVLLGSIGTLAFQGTFFLVPLLPRLRLALIYIPIGIAFHVSIYILMKAPFFQFIVLYAVFVPWAEVAKDLSRRFSRFRPSGAVVD